MKIVQIITRMDDIGGAQIHVRDLVSQLKVEGYTIYLITGRNANIHEEINQHKIPLINCVNLKRDLNFFSDIRSVLEMRKHLASINPDIIATHSSKAGIIGRIAGWSLKIPTVFTAHGWSYTEGVSKNKRKLFILVEKVVGWISVGVITVSNYDKQLAIKNKVLKEKKITTIHNGVHDIDQKEMACHTNKTPHLIMVARFAPPKQQLKVLEVLNDIRHIPWEISFAGDGPLLAEAKSYVRLNNLEDRVAFLGNQRNVTALLQKTDLFVLLSDWEGLPLSILEAMRAGIPIIASNVGGVKEAVMHCQNGYLVNNADNVEVKECLLKLLTTPKLRHAMGEESRKVYEEKFHFKKMYDQTLAYYQETVQSIK